MPNAAVRFKKPRRLIFARDLAIRISLSPCLPVSKFLVTFPKCVRSTLPPQFGIENIAQAVAQQIDAEYRDKNCQARKNRQPRRAIDVTTPLAQHGSPGRNMHGHSKAEKAQACFRDDDDRHAESRDY